jgi:hypothetical protein
MSFEQKYLKYKQKYLELKNQIGGDGKADVTAFAAEKGMSLNDFHTFLMNVNYYKNKNPAYDNKGCHNPMIIGNYVVRAIGHRSDLELQVRPKEATDTPDAVIKMADVTDNVYILIKKIILNMLLLIIYLIIKYHF